MAIASIQALADIDVWQALAVAAKALTYTATFAASGGTIFSALFTTRLSEVQQTRLARHSALAALAAIALSLVRIGVTNGMMNDDPAGIFDTAMTRTVLRSSEGGATAVRLTGLLIIALTAVITAKRSRWASGIGAVSLTGLAGALLAATSFALVGHATEVEGAAKLPQLLLGLHLIAAAFWIGALWPLHQLTYDEDIGRIASIMHGFGRTAIGIVGVLVAVGALLLWLILASSELLAEGRVDALWRSSYVQLVLAKILFVALLLALAGLNKLRLTPLLLRGDKGAVPRIRASIRAEMALAFVILLITASFTTLVGPGG